MHTDWARALLCLRLHQTAPPAVTLSSLYLGRRPKGGPRRPAGDFPALRRGRPSPWAKGERAACVTRVAGA
eukprot:5013074-Alexandrium_andersonii.AAC.1